LQALLDRVDEATALIYLANPNNPTGALLTLNDLETFAGQVANRSPAAVVLIDEAYMDYVLEAPRPEAQNLVKRFPVVVGRTLSKAFGLAGLRAGYAIGNPELVLTLNGFLSGYLGGDAGWRMFEGNINRMADAALQSCLSDEGLAFLESVRTRNAALRDQLAAGLQARGFEPLPSHASFLMVHVKSDGENLRRCLCSRKLLVQAGVSFHSDYGDWIRVSVGTEEEIRVLLEALEGYDSSCAYPASFPVFYHGI